MLEIGVSLKNEGLPCVIALSRRSGCGEELGSTGGIGRLSTRRCFEGMVVGLGVKAGEHLGRAELESACSSKDPYRRTELLRGETAGC
jgi:hypothetical protein